MIFAKMDVLSGEEFFRANFNFTETDPYNYNFEQFGFESMNFIYNSGSFLLIMTGIIAYYFIKFILVKVCVVFARFKIMRVIGMWV